MASFYAEDWYRIDTRNFSDWRSWLKKAEYSFWSDGKIFYKSGEVTLVVSGDFRPLKSGETPAVYSPGTRVDSVQIFNIDGVEGYQLYGLTETLAGVFRARTPFQLKRDGETFSINGSQFGDFLGGTAAADRISGENGNDIVRGRSGHDEIYGGRGGDDLAGNAGGDTLYGDGGGDTLSGGRGADFLFGGGGDDVLVGGRGWDWLDGGAGRDVFHFSHVRDSRYRPGLVDSIDGFRRGVDKIDLSEIDANARTAKDEAFKLVKEFADRPGEMMVSQSGSVVSVLADINGDGRADFALEISDVRHLGKGDFIL